ncbi:porin family protein [Luteibacter pinisoli]|uniref:Porin family protein n=2 Tax=Luteibacter pinisoli TaxID=2589080 RepID=A0A4Y5Z6T4_9GAMM|nr:porin family protein [Luteibacter pinisoli]
MSVVRRLNCSRATRPTLNDKGLVMKRTLILTALLLGAVPLATHAADGGIAPSKEGTAQSGLFLHGTLGKSSINIDRKVQKDTHGRHANVLVGYRWAVADRFALGVEGGYAWLGQMNHRQYLPIRGSNNKALYTRNIDLRAYLLGGNFKWHIDDQLSLAVRGGIARSHGHQRDRLEGPGLHRTSSNHADSVRPYVGLSLGYAVIPKLTLSIDANRYFVNKVHYTDGRTQLLAVNTLGLGAEYTF